MTLLPRCKVLSSSANRSLHCNPVFDGDVQLTSDCYCASAAERVGLSVDGVALRAEVVLDVRLDCGEFSQRLHLPNR